MDKKLIIGLVIAAVVVVIVVYYVGKKDPSTDDSGGGDTGGDDDNGGDTDDNGGDPLAEYDDGSMHEIDGVFVPAKPALWSTSFSTWVTYWVNIRLGYLDGSHPDRPEAYIGTDDQWAILWTQMVSEYNLAVAARNNA